MLVIQRLLHPTSKKTYMSAKLVDREIGFKVGDTVNVFLKGDVLLFTKKTEYPGFSFVKDAKVFLSQRRAQAQLFQPWVKTHMEGLTHLRAYYTKHGIFIRPYHGEEFVDYEL